MDRKLLQYLVEYLVEEGKAHGCALPPAAADAAQGGLASASTEALWLAFRSLVNVRPPWPAPGEFLATQDELLQGLIAEAGVATLADTTVANRPAPTLVARRHHHLGRRRHRERRQLRHDRLLGAATLLHRQRHPHFRRCAIACGLCEPHGSAGAPGANVPGQGDRTATTCPRATLSTRWGPSPTDVPPIRTAVSWPSAIARAWTRRPRRGFPASLSAASPRVCSGSRRKRRPPSPSLRCAAGLTSIPMCP